MEKLSKKIVIICLLLATVSGMAMAQQVKKPKPGAVGTWRLLGTTQAKHTADHDAIIVAGPYDYFRKLKFKVTDAPLNMIRMVVRYDDGGLPENIDIRFNKVTLNLTTHDEGGLTEKDFLMARQCDEAFAKL